MYTDRERSKNLLNKTTFDGDDLGLLAEAADLGYLDVIVHCEKNNLFCGSYHLSKAVQGQHYDIIDRIHLQQNNCEITLHCSERLIRNNDKHMLQYLNKRDMIGKKSIFQFIQEMKDHSEY